jgi:GTPase SAR1 family protein
MQLQLLYLSSNQLTALPQSLGNLTQLQSLNLSHNNLTILPELLGHLMQLQLLDLFNNQLIGLPESLGNLTQLRTLYLSKNNLTVLPESLDNLTQLKVLSFRNNRLIDIPSSLVTLTDAVVDYSFNFKDNPLNPELAEAYKQGLDAVKAYLRAKAAAQITLNEAKLILVGEGEVGKTCLMDALLGNPWQTHDSTHGIEIKPIQVTDPDTNTEITLNGWDFGGQRVYRPTHQLFFSAPAVYLVVWKPREGPQQGFVKEWIQLIKRREPTAKILVVATHGGPQQRQPDIDRQELWDLFGKETVVEFFFVESKPDANGHRKGIEELKQAIARIAAGLPEVGRSVPKSFQDVRGALQERNVPYLSLDDVFDICREHNMDEEIARLFITISHRLGHLTHYQNDPTLGDIVILRPDWLATAMSYVLDDEETRKNQGLVKFSRLSQLWNDPSRPPETRYSEKLHRIFLRLMERFDLSYRVVGISPDEENNPVSLIAQLVSDNSPEKELENAWPLDTYSGDLQQTQICRIVDAQTGQSANAEGLFYQLIVRLHKYSLGRALYDDSVHWQRGLVLDDNYNGRALLRHIGNDVYITVRAAFPVNFLAMLTSEVKYLIESFWEGLQCDVMVPCLNPAPCIGLFEVGKLIENKKRGRPEQPCPVCNEWQGIESLLLNAPAAHPDAATLLFAGFAEVKEEVSKVRQLLIYQGEKTMGRFDRLDDRQRRTLSRVDKTYTDLLQVLTDEAKEGPRLFSLVPVNRSKFNPREWTRAKFRLPLWCEHSRLPLTSPALNGPDSKKGVYDIELTHEWFKKAGPYLKLLTGTLSLVLPVALSGIKLRLDDDAYKAIEEELTFSKSIIDLTIGEGAKIGEFWGTTDATRLEPGESTRAEGATLHELHTILKKKDPGFGGLIRVMNKRQEFLWVHEQFEKEY